MDTRAKLCRLAEDLGVSLEELIAAAIADALCPAICTNDGCDYTTEYEPDQRAGWCELCGTRSVQSALVLAGMV